MHCTGLVFLDRRVVPVLRVTDVVDGVGADVDVEVGLVTQQSGRLAGRATRVRAEVHHRVKPTCNRPIAHNRLRPRPRCSTLDQLAPAGLYRRAKFGLISAATYAYRVLLPAGNT